MIGATISTHQFRAKFEIEPGQTFPQSQVSRFNSFWHTFDAQLNMPPVNRMINAWQTKNLDVWMRGFERQHQWRQNRFHRPKNNHRFFEPG